MILTRRTTTIQILALLISFGLPLNSHSADRWYNQAQADKGKPVFNTNCAICHGVEAAGTPEWRKPLTDGRYPAPPLNGTAHAWHHPLQSLRLQINQGGSKLGGWMPALGETLTTEQVNEVIAYFQSLWPDEQYAAWLEIEARQTGPAPVTVQVEKEAARDDILRHLKKRLPNARFGKPEKTPLEGIFRLTMDDKIIYISSEGRYVFLGDMVDLVAGRNISKKGVP